MARALKHSWLLLSAFFLLHAAAASAGNFAVLCSAEVQGDSVNADTQGCIDIQAWSWGASSTATVGGGGGGGGAGAPNFQVLTVTKFADSSSDDLLKALATGSVFNAVTLRVYRTCASGCSAPYITINMSNVQVTTHAMGGSHEGSDTENVSLIFSKFKYCYTSPAAGSQAQCFAYDIAMGTST